MNTPTTAERIAKTLWNNGMLRAAFQDAAAGLINTELERERQQVRSLLTKIAKLDTFSLDLKCLALTEAIVQARALLAEPQPGKEP